MIRLPLRSLATIICFSLTGLVNAKEPSSFSSELATPQKSGDVEAVRKLATEWALGLGDKAGVPDEESQFVMPDEDARPLLAEQVPGLFARGLGKIQENPWWKTVKSGVDCEAPLRAVASVVEGCLLAKSAGCDDPEALTVEARAAADFLLKAQSEGGRGCFPFPAWKGKRGKLGVMADGFLKKAEAAGKMDQVVKDGWIIDDLDEGDLYFDTGLAGSAVLDFYEFSKEEKYLKSAEAAAAWAMEKPAVANWNYNSFLVQFFSRIYHVTKDMKYLEAAKTKARLGVLPGQLADGPRAGCWLDPHNARLVYHFILLRGIITLLVELPEGDADKPALEKALKLGLQVRNKEIIEEGGTNPDTTLDVYCRLLQNKDKFEDIIFATDTYDASRMIFRVVVDEFKNEHPTVSPGSWGRYLKLTSGK